MGPINSADFLFIDRGGSWYGGALRSRIVENGYGPPITRSAIVSVRIVRRRA